MPSYYAAVQLELRNRSPNSDLSGFDVLSWKISHRLLMPWGTFTQILGFLRFFIFKLGARTRQTDGQDT